MALLCCMQDVESIDVPEYSSKFDVLCHAEEEMLVREGEAWLRTRAKELISGRFLRLPQLQEEDGSDQVERLIASKLGHVSCRFWPYCQDPKLALTLVKIMYWFFVFDNIMDEPSMLGTDAVAAQQFCGLVLQAFFTVDASQPLRSLDHLLPTPAARSSLMPFMTLTLLVEWWAELHAGMSTKQQARFCSHFADYVLMNAKQARFREEEEVPGMEEYMRMQIVGGAMYVVEMLAELACEIELDEEDLRNSSMKRLNEAIGLHACLLNDYLSFATEYERGEYFNMLIVLHYHNNIKGNDKQNTDFVHMPFHRTCAEAWKILATIEEECVASAKAVQEWAHTHFKLGLLKYVASLCSISAANWLFTLQSCRFVDSHEHCIQLPALKKDLASHPKSTTPISTRIFLKRPNTRNF